MGKSPDKRRLRRENGTRLGRFALSCVNPGAAFVTGLAVVGTLAVAALYTPRSPYALHFLCWVGLAWSIIFWMFTGWIIDEAERRMRQRDEFAAKQKSSDKKKRDK
jgi:hypothetical protein